jgi:hypothetical protein
MRNLFSLIPIVIFMSALGPQCAMPDEPKGYLSLILSGVSAERHHEYVIFNCEVVLQNTTANEIQVISNFGSQVDGIEIVVTNDDGQILVQQPLTYHQDPVYREGKAVAIKKGKSSVTLSIPVYGIDAEFGALNVRLAGQLSRSSYRHVCSTDTKKVIARSAPR